MEIVNGETSGPKTSALAVWSLVLGLLSFLLSCVSGVPAIILGAVGLKKIGESNGLLEGKGMAIAGIVCGAVFTLTSIVLASVAMPVYGKVTEKAKVVKAVSTTNQIVLSCRVYAADHDGLFPPNLEALSPDYLDGSLLPDQWDYNYIAGATDSGPEKVIVYSDQLPVNPPKWAVGFSTGRVAEMNAEEFRALLE